MGEVGAESGSTQKGLLRNTASNEKCRQWVDVKLLPEVDEQKYYLNNWKYEIISTVHEYLTIQVQFIGCSGRVFFSVFLWDPDWILAGPGKG